MHLHRSLTALLVPGRAILAISYRGQPVLREEQGARQLPHHHTKGYIGIAAASLGSAEFKKDYRAALRQSVSAMDNGIASKERVATRFHIGDIGHLVQQK
jgi:hypothetical protein